MSRGAECVLEATGLRVERGGVPVLDVPSFRLRASEFVSLIGPNGSGKSSLMLALMGLIERSAGEVRFCGQPIASGDAGVDVRRRMAMVLQEPLLFDTTVHENVASGLRLRALGRAEIRERVRVALARFGLTHMADRAARKLSGGEARRVSLARALAVKPDVLFLDEPFANLDLPTRHAIMEDLARTIREERIAAALITHDQAEALRLSDRIDVMTDGRIVQSDTPAAVMTNPVNEFAARCVGMEAILEGVVRRKSPGGEVVVDVSAREVHAVGDVAAGDRVYCCIRPEVVILETSAPSRTTSARNNFAGRVTGVASVGPYVRVALDCGFPLVAHVTRESFVALGLADATEVFASFKATAVHLLRR